MNSLYSIYEIINPNGSTYIGVTNNFNRRMSEHYSDWKNRKQNIGLHNSFSKYGYENHQKNIIIYNLNEDIAYKIEKNVVNKDRIKNKKLSLNSREGGLGGNMIDWKSEKGKKIQENFILKIKDKYNNIWNNRLLIILKLKDTHTVLQISQILNCSTSALCRFLKDNNIKIKRKNKYNLIDISKEILPYYKNGYNNKQIIELTGYSKGTIGRAKKLLNIGDEGIAWAQRKLKEIDNG